MIISFRVIEDSQSGSRHGLTGRLVIVFLSMTVSQLVGSAFNIAYNIFHLEPLLSKEQVEQFEKWVAIYNLSVYPPLVVLWAYVVFSLRKILPAERLLAQQRRVIHLPMWASAIAFVGWIMTIPVLLFGLSQLPEEVSGACVFHLSVSVILSTVVAISLGYLLMDWIRMWLLYPYFFDKISPSKIKNAIGLSVMGRGVLWTISACVSPVLALSLIHI